MKLNHTITDIPGLRVGHAQNDEAMTGCTVVLCEGGAVGGVDQRGGAPGTRETDALHPMHLVQQVHAVVLAGGSAFGLDAATGVVRYLEERGVGFDVRVARVPIVPAAILFDLSIGQADIRPDAAMGYQACLNATTEPPAEGNVGAGTGATVGKALGMEFAMKSGVGTSSLEIGNGIIVGAIVAVNAFGDIIDPNTAQIIAGARKPGRELSPRGSAGRQSTADEKQSKRDFADTLQVMRARVGSSSLRFGGGQRTSSRQKSSGRKSEPENTVIGVVATNAQLNKEQANKVAQMAQDGLARTVRPAHTMLDGDTIFALSSGDREVDVNIVGTFAAEVFAQAILRAVRAARPAGGLPAISPYSD